MWKEVYQFISLPSDTTETTRKEVDFKNIVTNEIVLCSILTEQLFVNPHKSV